MIIQHPGHAFVIDDSSPYSKYHIAEVQEGTGDISSIITMCLKDTGSMSSVGKDVIDSMICSKCRSVYLALKPQSPYR